ncbi:MAG: hypothetical protein ACK5XN_25240 [Bacteroidota bacterium]
MASDRLDWWSKRTKGEAMSTLTSDRVTLTVTRYGDFGDRLQLNAIVDGVSADDRCDILSVIYRGRDVAWITFPLGADRDAVVATVLAKSDWFLGSRCPDMVNFPLTFE